MAAPREHNSNMTGDKRVLDHRTKILTTALAVGIVLTIVVSLVSVASIHSLLYPAPSPVLTGLPDQAWTDNQALGVRLVLSINSSSIAKGETVAINVTVQNLLSTDNQLNSDNHWKISNLGTHPCGGLGSLHPPIRYAVFQGYHTENDVASASPMVLWSPGPYFCPALPSDSNFPEWFVFAPNSHTASFYSCNSNPCFAIAMSTGWAFGGSWTDRLWATNPVPGDFHPFSSGVYTVVGGDEWGDLSLLHFVVS